MGQPELRDALESVQRILREVGLPHLAAQVPVRAADDPEIVRAGIRVVDGLLRLRPPTTEARARLAPPLKKVADLLK